MKSRCKDDEIIKLYRSDFAMVDDREKSVTVSWEPGEGETEDAKRIMRISKVSSETKKAKQKEKYVGNALQIPTEEKRERVDAVSGRLGRLKNNRGRVKAKPTRSDDF